MPRFRAAASAVQPPALPGSRALRQLDNGLTVAILTNRQAPIVATAMVFRAGTRDEAAGNGGVAHFLEHMMFKGAERYGRGAIDRRTQELGGANNAFTSHDLTVYFFNFAGDRWREALDMEADRLTSLTLDPAEIASERQVIAEEIAMYESEPWDALELAVAARLFADHPYGKPVLGTSAELAATGRDELAAFAAARYRPDSAICVLAGDIGEEGFAEVERRLGDWRPGSLPRRPPTAPSRPSGVQRVERDRGEVARLLMALPAPSAQHADHPAARLLAAVLGTGRSSRLQRAVVDEGQLASWVSVDVNESLDGGQLSIAAEVVPGVEPERLEAAVLAELARLADEPPGARELDRAKQVTVADWVFAHERVHEQAVVFGAALALFGEDHLERELAALRTLGSDELAAAAASYLQVERGAVIGWSRPGDRR